MLPRKLQKKLNQRIATNALRTLDKPRDLVDFSSNDYLGFSSNPIFAKAILTRATTILKAHDCIANGATGSRLLSGNHALYEEAERAISLFHDSEDALIFNSGYDANIGFFQSVPQRGDLIIYDEYIHASIRDGIQMSLARGYKFKHNDLANLEKVLLRLREIHHAGDQVQEISIYIVTESVFSMDGDTPDLEVMVAVCKKHHARIIVDEAHATGVMGLQGKGLIQQYHLEHEVFARMVTFGKGIGAHGAAILCKEDLKSYLINYARSFIYTTGLPPHSLAIILASYEELASKSELDFHVITKLAQRIHHFRKTLETFELHSFFIPSESAIHCAVVSGNGTVKEIAKAIQKKGFDVRPILSPTVPEGQERLRICLHAHNTDEQIYTLLKELKKLLK